MQLSFSLDEVLLRSVKPSSSLYEAFFLDEVFSSTYGIFYPVVLSQS
jgi:hypothetical protein